MIQKHRRLLNEGSPARAGIDLEQPVHMEHGMGLPRTGGDRPHAMAMSGCRAGAPPHGRG